VGISWSENGCFKARGIQKIISYPGSKAHETYLKRMGFDWNFVLSDRRLYELTVKDYGI
jgi:hypothetical protein